jgi:adenylate cyclase
VAVQAQAVRSWLAPPLQHAAPAWPVLLTFLASGVGFVGARGRVTRIWIYAAISAIALALLSVVAFAFDYVVPVAGAMAAALVAAASASAYSAWRGWQERLRVAQVFGGYVSPGVFQKLLAGEIDTRTRRLQDCAFLFADIRNFTAVTESIGPSRALEFLNLYYAHATEIIHSAGGTIESFRGDGLAAFFGAPQPLDDAAAAGLKAARDLLLMLPVINRKLEADSLPLIDIGIGLSKGTGIAGHVGSADRYHYSVIGTATNLAARLQELCKLLGVGLLASPEFVRSTSAPWRSLGVQPIKGVGDIEVFTLDA